MKIHVNKAAVRFAAAAGLLVGSSLVACSSSSDGSGDPIIPSAGKSSTSGASSGGTSAGSSTGGTGGAAAGSSSGGTNGCVGNQLKDMTTGACSCPTYAPTLCDDVMKCINQTKDPDHCGNCTTKCAATSACSESTCTPEPTSITEVAGCGTLKLQQADGKLYMLATMTGALTSVPIPAGAATPTPIATGLAMGSAFAIDATNAYVVTDKTIQSVPLAGGTPAVIVTETTPIFDVAVAGGKLYYAVGKDVKEVAAPAGGTGVSVAVGIDEGEPQGVAISAGTVLYASAQAFNVEADPIAAGEGHLKLGASQGGLIFGHRSVQADAMYVYWAVNGTVQRAPFGGADHAQKTAGTAIGNVTAYAINATTVYMASDMGDLEKATFGAEKSTWVARGLGKVSSLVVDATSVYAASESCKVLKTAL